jgi:translation initiation factor eIF-2B subunit epsilon
MTSGLGMRKPMSRGEGIKPGPQLDNMKKCWAVGKRMIEQFDEQDSDQESE